MMGRGRRESQGERERREPEPEHGEERVDSTVKERRFQGGKEGQAKRACLDLPRKGRRKHERASEHKSSPGRSAESLFHS